MDEALGDTCVNTKGTKRVAVQENLFNKLMVKTGKDFLSK